MEDINHRTRQWIFLHLSRYLAETVLEDTVTENKIPVPGRRSCRTCYWKSLKLISGLLGRVSDKGIFDLLWARDSQWRVGYCRTKFYATDDILVLDELTAGLDPQGEGTWACLLRSILSGTFAWLFWREVRSLMDERCWNGITGTWQLYMNVKWEKGTSVVWDGAQRCFFKGCFLKRKVARFLIKITEFGAKDENTRKRLFIIWKSPLPITYSLFEQGTKIYSHEVGCSGYPWIS